MQVTKRDGTLEQMDVTKIHKCIEWACKGLDVSQSEIETNSKVQFFNEIKTSDIHQAMINSSLDLCSIEKPDYEYVAARLLLQTMFKTLGHSIEYPKLIDTITKLYVAEKVCDELVHNFDFEKLEAAITPERDFEFKYLGLKTLHDRYFLTDSDNETRLELPQHFWMRVAMGLAYNEDDPTERAIEFYNVLSQLLFINSTPTLFNSGTRRQQLSSCYVNLYPDSLDGIMSTNGESANYSKYSGGLGSSWSLVRGEGDNIKGTSGVSSGYVPYIKVYNDIAVAVNQGGKRKGAFAPYSEMWHPDIESFIELKKEVGDERRRARDVFPALWVCDLFMKRKEERGMWSLFSPKDYPELHHLHGEAFEKRYTELESKGKFVKQIPAFELWKKSLSLAFETGAPWITFKDEGNRRNPQQHKGTIHSSNLCTEIMLNTSEDETAVCNLGSVNLSRITDFNQLSKTVKTAMRMLDNVIDINFYPHEKAYRSNMRHRPVGLGVMGYAEYLAQRNIDWESEEHIAQAGLIQEVIAYYAFDASCELAIERGSYGSFEGSLSSKGLLPPFTAQHEDGTSIDIDRLHYNWCKLADKIKTHGLRNSNVMAIAPTATIAEIAGTTPGIDPVFEHVKTVSGLSGKFKIVDPCLRHIRPQHCKTGFDIDNIWLIRAAAVRQWFIDQSQSLNFYIDPTKASGKMLDALYTSAWKHKLKSTYYMKNKSVVVDEEVKESSPMIIGDAGEQPIHEAKMCSIDNPDCESCQ